MNDDITDTTTAAVNDDSSDLSTKSDDFETAKKEMEADFLEDGDTYEELIEGDILTLMGFKNLSEEKRKALHEKIQKAIENRVAVRILDAIPDEDLKEYDQLSESKDRDKLEEFMKDRGIDIAKWTMEEIWKMKLELYQDSKIIKQQLEEISKQSSGE